ncbi:exodeoxyribonuclease III [Dialister invisus]|uniref:exodeoxyribonuclease III n=1 Tax=Dialister invisus TaxID=218538 RepID=UPI00399292F9
MKSLKYISWNVNGLRACIKKGFMQSFKELDADCFCLQETKLQPDQIELDLPGYHQYWNSAVKKGYSGTALFTKTEPRSVTYGIGIEEHDQEGRVITAEFNDHCLVTCYTPNSQRGLARLAYRMKWEDDFKKYLLGLSQKKPVILCGDLNVAHEEIDLANPTSNHMNAGFTDDERNKMTELLSDGFTDSFRYLHPNEKDTYSWWSYFAKSRERNIGWRIDYFLVSDILQPRIKAAEIHSSILGSDHCPVELDIEI